MQISQAVARLTAATVIVVAVARATDVATIMTRRNILLVVCILVLICLVPIFYFWSSLIAPFLQAKGILPLGPGEAETNKVLQLAIGGDFTALAQSSHSLADIAVNDNQYQIARIYEAYANFMQGSPETRKAAVKIVIDLYTKTNSPAVKAMCLNQLIQFVVVDRTPDIYNAVFANDAFKKYNKQGDLAGSVAALARESYGDKHTVIGATYILLPDEAPLLNFDKQYSLTPEEKKAHADAVIAGTPNITTAYQEEQADTAAFLNREVLPFTYFNSVALMYEAVSTVDSSYQAKAIEEYQNLFKYSDSAKGTDGKILPAIEVHLWEEDLRYAVLIYRQDPVKNLNEAQAHIKAAIDRVATNPQLNELGLPIYIKNRASGLEGARGMNKLILLAKIYPPFRDFAQKYGVTIPASKQ